jgi:hypothetical protein
MTAELDERVGPKNIKSGTWGGNRPGTGGRQPGSGRKKGSPNKITREIKEIAHQYGPGALKELARIATQGESDAARVAACREILDRAYGKAMQPIQGTVDYGISEQLAELFRGNEGNTLGAEIARRAALPPPNGQQPH